MEYEVVASESVYGLNQKVKAKMAEGFRPIGAHLTVVSSTNIERAHMPTQNNLEYSQTMLKQ